MIDTPPTDVIIQQIMDELDDRSLFNGVDDNIKEEIYHALWDIVARLR